MGDRIEELKGKAKEGLGSLTGDEEMKNEGRGEAAMAKTKREVESAAKQAAGKVKERVGRLTGDEEMRARGKADDLEGEAGRTG